MKTDRRHKLLRDISKQFDNRSLIMNDEWLTDNNISFDEMGGIASTCHLIIEGFLAMSELERQKHIAKGAAYAVLSQDFK